MSYKYFNPNKLHKDVGDCVIRAYAAATNIDWDTAFIKLTLRAYVMHDMPSSNAVWDAQLISGGFSREIIPNLCPDCYTVKQFADEHPHDTYVLVSWRIRVTAIQRQAVSLSLFYLTILILPDYNVSDKIERRFVL